jgi:hypothetical protein
MNPYLGFESRPLRYVRHAIVNSTLGNKIKSYLSAVTVALVSCGGVSQSVRDMFQLWNLPITNLPTRLLAITTAMAMLTCSSIAEYGLIFLAFAIM